MRPPFRAAWLAVLALAGVGATPPRPARAEPADRAVVEYEDGAQAPAHGWTQEDGCPARTGASAARVLRGPLERAWKTPATDGTIAGEPLAWKDRVFVEERTAKRRVLRVLAAATGVERTRLTADTSLALHPSVGEGRLLVRTSPTLLEGLAVGDAALTKRWRVTAKTALGGATMLRDEVYLVRDGVLERWAYGAATPTWPKSADSPDVVKVEPGAAPAGADVPGPRFSRPSLRGGSVFVVSGRDLVEVDRATGAAKGRASLEGEVDPEAARVVVAGGDVFVRGAAAATADAADTFRFTRYTAGIEARAGLRSPSGLAALGPAWIGVLEAAGAKRLCAGRPSDDEPLVLAGDGAHDEFVATVPPTVVTGAVYEGLRAFGFPSLTVLRSSGAAVASRAVPLRDRVLVVENPTTLSAWREARRGDDRMSVKPAGPALAVKGCRAALDDGRVVEGPFTFDAKANLFKSTKTGELASCPLRSVLAVLTADAPRHIVLAGAPAEAAAGIAAIARAETARTILALVPSAVAAGDADLAHKVLGAAVEHGVPDAEVASAEAAVAALEAAPRAREEAKATEVEAQLAALEHREVEVLFDVAQALPKDAPQDLSVALVRAVVERDPQNDGAAKWVRARLPKELHPAEPMRLDDWLDFIEVRAKLQVHVWGVDTQSKRPWGSEGAIPSEDSDLFRNFWSAHSTWPGEVEVVAFECGPLVAFSPLERPGAIVRCLALGRLVSDTLDKTFAPEGAPRSDVEKLILHLFSTRDQYLEVTKPWGEAERKDGLENTAGHYSPGDNVTRMFFPDSDDSFDVPGVYAHELTHHWIERRRPGTSPNDHDSGKPGYWVVEGFADFVKGFVFDVEGQKANPENPRAEYADTLSGIAPESLIPWPKLLTLTQAQFHELSIHEPIPVNRRWRLGPKGATAPMILFYDQGAAVCAYLYLAEKEKYRKALLDYVYAYYEGKTQSDTLQKAIGMSYEELGKRVVAWCKELTKKG